MSRLWVQVTRNGAWHSVLAGGRETHCGQLVGRLPVFPHPGERLCRNCELTRWPR